MIFTKDICICYFLFVYMYFFYFDSAGDPQKDSVTVVLHKQPAGRVHQSSVRQLLQPCALPCSQFTTPGALGWLLHPLEPSHETSGVLKLLAIRFGYCPRCTRSLHLPFSNPFLRNLFTSAIKNCWRSEPSYRRGWTSCSGTWPTARHHLPQSVPAPPLAPSPQCRPLFDSREM